MDKVSHRIVTGDELTQLARKMYSDSEVKKAMKDLAVMDFFKISLMLATSSTTAPDEVSKFGHLFNIRNNLSKDSFEVTFNVSVSCKKVETK